MLAPCLILASVCRAAFSPIPSGRGSFARLTVFAALLLAVVSGFAQVVNPEIIPRISASFENTVGSEKITLNFTSEVNSSAGSIAITEIADDGTTIIYAYKGDLSVSSSSSLELLLSDFAELLLPDFEIGDIISLEDKNYVLEIPAGTFKDEYGNKTEEYIFNFNGNGDYYDASLNRYSFIKEKIYDKEALSVTFELANLSSGDITIEKFLEQDGKNFDLIPDFNDGSSIAKDEKATFEVSLNNKNAGIYNANLVIKLSNGIRAFNVPIEIFIDRKPLESLEIIPNPKEYDNNTHIELIVKPTDVVPGDEEKVKLVGSGTAYSWDWWPVGSSGYYGWIPNPNVAGRKCVGDIEVRWPDDFHDADIIDNYELPLKLEGVPPNSTTSNIPTPNPFVPICNHEATIIPVEWFDDVDIPPVVATPSSFLYDLNFGLDKIDLNILNETDYGSWRFRNLADAVINPHDLIINPNDDDSVAMWYAVEFVLHGEDPMNYPPKQDEVQLIIHKRSLNSELKSATKASNCGERGILTIEAEDPTATVFVSDEINSLGTLTLPMNLEYGADTTINYSIISQAYESDNPNYRNEQSFYFERSIPFNKVAYWIRGKTLTLNFDTSDPSVKDFFERYEFDYAKTEWYRGKELVYIGRNYSVPPGSTGDDYSVILTGKDNEIRFTTCKESGAYPEVTPLMPRPAGNRIKLAASSFGSRMVPGGTNFVLNTPEGGKISVYTVSGEFVTRMNAVDARTIVRLPKSNKMYIVKLEAK